MLANGTETLAARPILKAGPYLNRTSLREYRLKAGIGSKKLAEQAGVPAFVVYQIENGHLNPRNYVRQLVKLAKLLDVPAKAVLSPCQLTPDQMQALEATSKAPRVGRPKKALLPLREVASLPALSAPVEPPAELPVPRTAKGQVQKLGIALTYDGQIIGGASLNLDTKALTPLIKRLLRAALDDD